MISQSEQLRHFRSNHLNLIILPTEACNFRCTYCYETFENRKMPRPVVTGIKSLIDRRGTDLDELEISWFGGEPLLALDVITEISKHALHVAKTEGFTFRSGMTTNGYFLDQDRHIIIEQLLAVAFFCFRRSRSNTRSESCNPRELLLHDPRMS
jgi:uncharacterized protein